MMNKKFLYRGLLLLALSPILMACNKERPSDNGNTGSSSEIQGQTVTATVGVELSKRGDNSDKALRAEFIGEGSNWMNRIKWGEVASNESDLNKALDMYVFLQGSKTKYSSAKLLLFESYLGKLSFAYNDASDVTGDKVSFFATNKRGKDAWITGENIQTIGAWVSDGMVEGDNVKLNVEATMDVMDMSKKSMNWPLISADPKAETQLWSKYDISGYDKKRTYVKFKFFGNMLNIRVANNSGIPNFNAYSDDVDLTHRPYLLIESNGMVFAPASFTLAQGAQGVEVTSSGSHSVKLRIDNLKFTQNGEEKYFPIWFRPVAPANGQEFDMKVTWVVYSKKANKWRKMTYTLDKEKAVISPKTKTAYDDFDGLYYGLSVAFGAGFDVEFGTNSFYPVKIDNIPAFD